MKCRHCKSKNTRKNGTNAGVQRYKCNACSRTFGKRPPRYSAKTKAKALQMHLNNVGIRKIALFLDCSPATVLYWIKQKHLILQGFDPEAREEADVIEPDEIYTFVQKNAKKQ